MRRFRFNFKFLPLILVLGIGLALGLTRGPTGIAGKAINDMGGTHKKALQDAYSKIVKGDFTEAAKIASAVIRDDPSNPLAYEMLGLADARRGLTDEAAVSLKKAVDLNPQFALAWFNLGVVEETLDEFPSALIDYRKAADLDSSNREFSDNADRLRRMVAGQGQWDQREKDDDDLFLDGMQKVGAGTPEDLEYAESTFRSLAVERPDDVAVRNMLGLTLAREGKTDEAEQILAQVTIDEPGYADAWYNLGMVHESMGRLNDSSDDFRKAIDMTTEPALKKAAAHELAQIRNELVSQPAGPDAQPQ